MIGHIILEVEIVQVFVQTISFHLLLPHLALCRKSLHLLLFGVGAIYAKVTLFNRLFERSKL